MDEARKRSVAYEYLCHLEEARVWLEQCLNESLPAATELEENLRNGVVLAKLAHFLHPDLVPLHRIYDISQRRYQAVGLQFKHTDNINYWLKSLEASQLPKTFHPETTDVYDKKNMPRVIYCLHALSRHLFKNGHAPVMNDFFGKISFSDEEVLAVQDEIDERGIKMPAFQKICELLSTDCKPVDFKSVVHEINDAIMSKDSQALLIGLRNPVAKLKDVNAHNISEYLNVLYEAKRSKEESSFNRSLDETYEPDDFDGLLLLDELQGHISAVNIKCSLQKIMSSSTRKNTDGVSGDLLNLFSSLNLKNVNENNIKSYVENALKSHLDSINLNDITDIKRFLQTLINETNSNVEKVNRITAAVTRVNEALDRGTVFDLMAALKDPFLGLNQLKIDDFSAPLYFEELKVDKVDLNRNLTYKDIAGSIDILFLISAVSRALDTGNPELVWDALYSLNAHLNNLDKSCALEYFNALTANRYYKVINACECPLLTYQNIQDCIDIVNEKSQENDAIIESLHDLNAALLHRNKNKALKILKNPILNLNENISDEDDEIIYMLLLEQLEKQKNDSELWLDDLERLIGDAKKEVAEIRAASRFLLEVNAALLNNDENGCLFALHENQILNNCQTDYSSDIYKSLKQLQRKKTGNSPWVFYITKKRHRVFINVSTGDYESMPPISMKSDEPMYISKEEIESIVSKVFKKQIDLNMEKLIMNFQAHCRGYLYRENLGQRLAYLESKEHSVRVIQNWWRKILLRRKINEINRLKGNHSTFVKRMDHYRQNVDKIIKIQALWRGRTVRQALTTISVQANPSFKTVCKFIPLLDFNVDDYRREIELQSLRKQVIQSIRHSQELTKQIDEMDLKIGLLVQNRISLEEVVTHKIALNDVVNKKSSSALTVNRGGGLKSLQKDKRVLLNGYQHLFYLLQTNPVYLSKLIFLVPYRKTQKLVHQIIMTLFNFGGSHRDEYLLLKLLKTSLEEEILNKFDTVQDVVTSNPLVLSMAVSYARQKFGHQSLRVILGPLIRKVLGNQEMVIDTVPVAIYKNWRSQVEMTTGKQSDLPLNVDTETALQYSEVRSRLETSIETLKSLTLQFLKRITQSKPVIPYGLLHMAKVLRSSLVKKFPSLNEKEILKVVGHLIYHQFFNSAIAAPDAFEIIPLEASKPLSNIQRHNLASIAKLLQFAASKKGFGEESKHLICLNPFIIECHEKFKVFFKDCCDVEDLESYYSITEYSEAIMIHQPSIFITLQELCDTHNLLHEYEYQIAPDSDDPLHELLDDLGCEPPTVAQLMGLNPAEEIFNRQLGKTELHLTLVNKFEVEDSKEAATEDTKLFIATKELLVRVMPFLNGHNLPGSLRIEPTQEQEAEFERRTQEILARQTINSNQTTNCFVGSLRDCKAKLRKYLNQLEEKGFVSRNDGYQSIISALAKDICNKRNYRKIQSQELQTIRETKKNLEDKICFYNEKVKYYNEYVQNCLENQRMKKNPHASDGSKSKKKLCFRYSAVKLKESGVLIEIEGLPQSQFKNVQFEIFPAQANGVFKVKGKFMGVEMETVEINLQDLLRKQYEGVTIMDMFGKAKININLLIFLLNKKFYS